MVQPVLFSIEKERSLDELIEESKADSDFILYLVVSAAIATFGLISNNGAVVIGGMLVAPILYPILSLSMGVATSSKRAIVRALKVIAKSVCWAVGVSLLMAFLFSFSIPEELNHEILIRTKPDLLSFFIALFAGIAASFGWVKKRSVSSVLAGIAVSVSLIPPLAAVSIGIAIPNGAVVAGALTLFLVNLLGILVAGIIIFALFGFVNLQKEEEKKITEEIIEEKIQKDAKKEVVASESDGEVVVTESSVTSEVNQDNS